MADAALEGVIQAIEVVKAEWALDTKMPEFTLQVQTTFTLHTAHCTLHTAGVGDAEGGGGAAPVAPPCTLHGAHAKGLDDSLDIF